MFEIIAYTDVWVIETFRLRRGRLRERDILNTKWCARVKQRLAGKRDGRRHSTTHCSENVVMTEELIKWYKFYKVGILVICHTISIITKRCQNKCRKRWRGGLKDTIELMLIRPYVNYVNCYFDIRRGVNLLHKNDHNNFSGANSKCVKSRPRLESKGL